MAYFHGCWHNVAFIQVFKVTVSGRVTPVAHISLLYTRRARTAFKATDKKKNVFTNHRIVSPWTDAPSVFIEELKTVIRPARCGWSCGARCKKILLVSSLYTNHRATVVCLNGNLLQCAWLLSEVNWPEPQCCRVTAARANVGAGFWSFPVRVVLFQHLVSLSYMVT